MEGFVDQASTSDQGQRKCGQQVMRPRRKQAGTRIPQQQDRNADQRRDAES